MVISFPSPEFDDAVAAVCHSLATEAEMRALNALLRTDPSARDEYLLRVEVHTRLASEPDLFSVTADSAASCPQPIISASGRRNIISLNPAGPATRTRLARVMALAAWVCIKGLDRQFNSLFMSDGFDPGTIHWLIRNDGVLGVTVFGPGNGKFQIMANPPVLSLDDLGMWQHLAVVIDGRAGRVVHYVNGLAVSHHTLKLRPPFRLGSAELGNWNARTGPNPESSLIRNLSGSLDEFELFSRALSDAEIRELYVKGKPDL